mmetsp:Transcript_124027/g.243303  ORF Transcript_124027/g.243303 Transcript_124027/m.243303 type:complete len:203 (-) Transcript_124027:170-778(-)
MAVAPSVAALAAKGTLSAPWGHEATNRLAELFEQLLRQEQVVVRHGSHVGDSVGREVAEGAASGQVNAATPEGAPSCPGTGACKPCRWHFSTADNCRRGVECEFCHVHDSGSKVRPCKWKRHWLDKTRVKLDALAAADPAKLRKAFEEIRSNYHQDPRLLRECQAHMDKLIARLASSASGTGVEVCTDSASSGEALVTAPPR